MPAIALTAAEIAAAEAAAIAAAEAAAIQAAQVAAAEAAAQAAATAAAEQAAAQAATQAAAQQATTSGIQTLAQEVAASPPTGIDQLTQAFQNAQVNNVPMSGTEFLNQSFAGEATSIPLGSTPPLPTPSAIPPVPGPTPVTPQLPSFSPEKYLIETSPGSLASPPPTPPAAPLYGSGTPPVSSGMGPNPLQDIYRGDPSLYTMDKAPAGYSSLNARPDLAGPSQYSLGNQAGNYNLAQTGSATPAAPQQPGGIESLFNKGVDFAKQNPLSALSMANTAYSLLNRPEPEEKKKYKSTFRSDLYTGYTPVQPTPYQPQYAVGGLADLGGYSDGGRMLKGPGDGMSDDIPATIAGKQPARLANEEFVIPADVVSHLGNGSSEAGAKQLYKMMDRIRKARTGTKKQGKQINPEKYLA
jgi:hypothetical protein